MAADAEGCIAAAAVIIVKTPPKTVAHARWCRRGLREICSGRSVNATKNDRTPQAYLSAMLLNCTHTHTHTHTQREKEMDTTVALPTPSLLLFLLVLLLLLLLLLLLFLLVVGQR